MKNEIWEEKMRLFDSFVDAFSSFWQKNARAQAYNQLIGAIDMQISSTSEDKNDELKVLLSNIKEKHEKQISEVFNSLIKLSGKDATEFSEACVDMLTNSTISITTEFAKIIGQFDDLTALFLGETLSNEDGDADE